MRFKLGHILLAAAVAAIVALSIALSGCALNTQVQYPPTPKGKGLLFINLWHNQRVSYLARFPLAEGTPDALKDKLRGQRIALVEGHFAIKAYCEYVATGRPVSESILARLNEWLITIEDDLVYAQVIGISPQVAPHHVHPDEVIMLMRKAGLIPAPGVVYTQSEISAQMDPVLIGALIELFRTSLAAFLELQRQAQMTPEQVEAEWMTLWPAFQSYDIASLPLVN